VRCIAAAAFLVLREAAFGGDPTGEAEEAPLTPRGKRSLVRKSAAVQQAKTKKKPRALKRALGLISLNRIEWR